MARALVFCAALASCLVCQRAWAAEPPRPVTVQGNARPSFQITPLIQRLSGLRGQRLPFSFEIRTLDRPQSLRIRAVAMKQQLDGLVVADEKAPPPDGVQLLGPAQLDLKAEQTATIRGHVNVPLSQAPFHTYGILVTDLGRPLQPGTPTGGDQKGVSVRFVTQYLLRLEIKVTNGRQENAKELRIDSARLVEHGGRAFVEADVANPSEAAVEFQLHCRLLRSDGTEFVPAFGLTLPVRASRQGPERYESMVFARNRVRLMAPVPEAVFPGEYQIELEWISRRRKCGEAAFAAAVREGDFPAQASESIQVGQALRVTPSQIELSLGRGGNRRLPLRVTNKGTQPLRVRLSPRNLDGTPADWVLLRPSTFDLPGGRDRNVLVTTVTGGDVEKHRYGLVRVEAGSRESAAGTRDLLIALLGRTAAQPAFDTGPVRWDPDGDHPAFVVPIDNQGAAHLPLKGRLAVENAFGQRMELPGGFDRWLLPGRQGEIRFPLRHRLPPGLYHVRVQIETAEGDEPRRIVQQVEVE